MVRNGDIETGEDKDNKKRQLHFQMKEQNKFITRSYWMCITLFFVTGVAMLSAVLQGAYKEVVLAENIMVTVFGTIYMVLLVIMCFCHKNETLRVAILLFVSGFIGVIGGFMIGVNLKLVVEHLQDVEN